MNRFIIRRIGLGAGLGLFALFVLSIPVLGLKGDDTYLSIAMASIGAVVFGFSIPGVPQRDFSEPRGFAVIFNKRRLDVARSETRSNLPSAVLKSSGEGQSSNARSQSHP